MYVNDITNIASSTLLLFADDCLLYRVIKSVEDTFQVQCDLDHLSQWGTWQMKFNPTKCTVIKCTRSHLIDNIQRLHTTRSRIRNQNKKQISWYNFE